MSKSDERKYLLMTSKHGSKQHPQFWGYRTEDDEPRSFGDYTDNPEQAEHYTSTEIMNEFADPQELTPLLPLEAYFGRLARYTPADWQQHTNSEDVFVTTVAEARDLTGAK